MLKNLYFLLCSLAWVSLDSSLQATSLVAIELPAEQQHFFMGNEADLYGQEKPCMYVGLPLEDQVHNASTHEGLGYIAKTLVLLSHMLRVDLQFAGGEGPMALGGGVDGVYVDQRGEICLSVNPLFTAGSVAELYRPMLQQLQKHVQFLGEWAVEATPDDQAEELAGLYDAVNIKLNHAVMATEGEEMLHRLDKAVSAVGHRHSRSPHMRSSALFGGESRGKTWPIFTDARMEKSQSYELLDRESWFDKEPELVELLFNQGRDTMRDPRRNL